MKVTVSRLEVYPAEEPTGWAVGLVCECDNGNSFYVDTVVSNTDAADDQAALDAALVTLGPGINERCGVLDARSSLIGSDVTAGLGNVVDDVVDDVDGE
jgi:hypothetical protein